MQDIHHPDVVIPRLVHWAEQQTRIRAMLLTSSRANPDAPVDILSDYDVVLVAQDIHPFFEDRTWIEDFGEVLVVYWDPIHPATDYDIEQVSNVIQYKDGLKIDFTLWPVELMERIAQASTLPADLDIGYTILVDKDHLAGGTQAPTYTAYLPTPPSEEMYQTVIQDFFSDAPYVAKCLWRDELLPAKWCLDYDMKHVYLRPMLEWRMGCEHNWSMPAGVLGRGLKKRLPPEIWSQLERAYAGGGIAENWEALFRTIDLFRRVAIDVGDHLGYTYPHDMDQGVTAYIDHVKNLRRMTSDE